MTKHESFSSFDHLSFFRHSDFVISRSDSSRRSVRPAPELSEDGLLASACGRHGRQYRATRGRETGGADNYGSRPDAYSTGGAKEHAFYRHGGANSDKGRAKGENVRIKYEFDRGQ